MDRQRGTKRTSAASLPAGLDAIALGTAAGSLIIGALGVHEARANNAAAGHDAAPSSLAEAMGWRSATTPAAPPTVPAPLPTPNQSGQQHVAAALAQGSATAHAIPAGDTSTGSAPQQAPTLSAADHSGAPVATADTGFAHAADHLIAGEASAGNPLAAQLTHSLAQEITSDVGQILSSIKAGVPVADIGISIAQNIHIAVADMLGTILPAAGVTDAAAGITATTDHLLATGFATIDAVPAALTEIPASLLGHEGSDIAGGLLSDIFYSDGHATAAPATPAISILPVLHDATAGSDLPALSAAAGALAGADAAPLHLGFLGQSYTDLADGHLLPATHNALHLA